MASARSNLAITPDILLQAYAAGLFPMAESADDDRLFWVEPEQRGIFPLDGLLISRSLAKVIRRDVFEVVTDRDFDSVIDHCAAPAMRRQSTWINQPIRDLFRELFAQGHAHTVEAYRGDRLVGGLYGLALGGAFFGESMFHSETDASKVCLVHLAARLKVGGFALLDAQFVTPHLATLGAVEVPKPRYKRLLEAALGVRARFHAQDGRLSGQEALAILRIPKDG